MIKTCIPSKNYGIWKRQNQGEKKRNFRVIVVKGIWYKAEIKTIDKKEVKLLFRNLNYVINTNKDEETTKDKWYIHPRKYEVKEIMHKAHWGSRSHLKIDYTVETIKDLGYCWEKMQKDIRVLYFNCEIWAGWTKKPKKKIEYKHIDSYYLKERYQADTVYLSDYLVSD